MKVSEILDFMNTIAPPYMKMEWDNVGLLFGSKDWEVKKILVALDPFEEVCREAGQWGADLIVTHHPLIFSPIKNITDETSIGRSIMLLAEGKIAAINAHTNLDCAPGGVNDCLAGRLGLENVEVVRPEGTDEQGRPWGLLRVGTVPEMPLEAFLERVKEKLPCPFLRYAEGGKPVHRVCVGGGACGSELMDAADAGCDTFLTADLKYNQIWDARDMGINIIDAGHFWTENPVCSVIAEKLQTNFPEIQVKLSEKHTDCGKMW